MKCTAEPLDRRGQPYTVTGRLSRGSSRGPTPCGRAAAPRRRRESGDARHRMRTCGKKYAEETAQSPYNSTAAGYAKVSCPGHVHVHDRPCTRTERWARGFPSYLAPFGCGVLAHDSSLTVASRNSNANWQRAALLGPLRTPDARALERILGKPLGCESRRWCGESPDVVTCVRPVRHRRRRYDGRRGRAARSAAAAAAGGRRAKDDAVPVGNLHIVIEGLRLENLVVRYAATHQVEHEGWVAHRTRGIETDHGDADALLPLLPSTQPLHLAAPPKLFQTLDMEERERP